MENNEFTEEEDEWFKSNSGLIIEIIEQNIEYFTPQEEDTLEICNQSMSYWINTGNIRRAMWETQNTLKILKQIIEF